MARPSPIDVNGRHGSQIYIVNTTQRDQRRSAADTIVYLTCLHESGHALGLQHTDQFADIMFYFGYGGDIFEYFGRYLRKLTVREDIRKNPGLSPADRRHLMEKLPAFEARHFRIESMARFAGVGALVRDTGAGNGRVRAHHTREEPLDPSKGVKLSSRIPCDGATNPQDPINLTPTFSTGDF